MTRARQFVAARTVLGAIAFSVLLVRSFAYLGAELPVSVEHAAVVIGLMLGLGLVMSRRQPAPLPLPDGATPITNIDEYAQFTVDLWIGGGDAESQSLRQHALMSMGLAGESGEVVEVVKKWFRDGVLDRANLRKELGDVFYYLARLCRAHGFQPSEVLGENRHKILDRKQRGTMQGSGDNR